MKKFLGIILAGAMLMVTFTGCSPNSSNASTKEDWDYIAAKKQLVIGITLFEPMNYKEDGELTGFETEFAKAVCEKLGVEAKFQEIDWKTKEVELNAKNIDCIWNGLTIDADRKENMAISTPYMQNKQIMVTKAENAANYTTAESLKNATLVAEAGSAGETVATTDAFFKDAKYTAVDSQANALMEVKSGTSDIAVIDFVMSIGSIGEGTDYADLAVISDKEFSPEEYGIAFRKGSTVTLEKVNAAIQDLANEGVLEQIATKYKLNDLLLVKAK